MINPSPAVPRVLAVSCEELAGLVPTLVSEVRPAFTDQGFFRSLAYGAGHQVLANLTLRGRVDFMTLAVSLWEDREEHEIPEDSIHHQVMLMQVFGILSPTQIGRISGVGIGAIRNVMRRPQAVNIRLGGTLPGDQLIEVQTVLKYKLLHGKWDYAALRNIRDAGMSITVLSRLVGLGAQRLSRWFNRTPADAKPLTAGWKPPFNISAIDTPAQPVVSEPDPEPVTEEVTEPAVEPKENHNDDHADSAPVGDTGAVPSGSLPVTTPPYLTGHVPPLTGDDDPRLQGDRPLVHIRDGITKLTGFGIAHYRRVAAARKPEVPAGSPGHADVADQPVQAG